MRRRPHAALGAFLLLMVAGASILLYAGRGLNFHLDEWALVLNRRDWNFDAFLQPHNEHLIMTTVAIFKVLFITIGLDNYWVYRVVLVLFHLVCVALLFQLLRRRVGDELAVLGCVPVLFLGSAWEVLLWPIQINILASLAAGLGMLLVLERNDSRSDWLAGILLVVAMASSTFGVPFAVAAVVEALIPTRRWRRLAAATAPVALYCLWYARYHAPVVDGLVSQNLGKLPVYVLDEAGAAFGALSGIPGKLGWILLVVTAFLLLPASRAQTFSPRMLSLLATLGTYWSLIALGRAQLEAPDSRRYFYVGVVLIVLIVAERWQNLSLQVGWFIALVAFATVSAVGNSDQLFSGRKVLRSFSTYLSAELGALEMLDRPIRPLYQPDPKRSPSLFAGPYLDAVEEFGSPADTPNEIATKPDLVRWEADRVLISALQIVPTQSSHPRGEGVRPRIEGTTGGTMRVRANCASFTVLEPGGRMTLEVLTPVILVTARLASVDMSLRRFSDRFSRRVATLRGQNLVVALPSGGYGKRWHVRFEALERGRLDVCGAGSP